MHALRQIVTHEQHLRDPDRSDAVAVEPAEYLEGGHGTQQYRPLGSLGKQTLALAARIAPARFQQPGRVVRALDERTDTIEIQGFVAQQSAGRDAARQVRPILHPLEKLATRGFQHARVERQRIEVGRIERFPHVRGDRAAHRAGVLSCCPQVLQNAAGMVAIEREEIKGCARCRRAMQCRELLVDPQ